MNAKAETIVIPSTVTDLEKRIAEERKRRQMELDLQAELEAQRTIPLESGDDAALDRIEEKLATCIARQGRIDERIEILHQRLEQTKQANVDAELDAIAARAEACRKEGERLIKEEYPKLAKPMAALLSRLRACTASIAEDNFTLGRAGRDGVPAPNDIRVKDGRRVDWIETRRVNASDPLHPEYELAVSAGRIGPLCNSETKQIIRPVDVEVDRVDYIPADVPTPLHEAVSLPRIEPMPHIHKSLPAAPVPVDFYDPTREATAAEIAEVRERPQKKNTSK